MRQNITCTKIFKDEMKVETNFHIIITYPPVAQI